MSPKEKPVYVPLPADFKPGPKNGHLSGKDPAYAAIFEATKEAFKPIWAAPIEQSKEIIAGVPPGLPEGCPEPGKDVLITQRMVPVRDGSEVEIQVYKSPRAQPDAALVFHMHGGGWVVGTHAAEEAENRITAALPCCVVVSVDYRMAPKYPFPYAINDAWDVLKWCKANASSLGIDPERIILAGDSAGGNLTIVTAMRARDEGLTGIVAMKPGFPVTCHPKFFNQVPDKDDHELLSYVQNCDDAMLSTPLMEMFWDLYAGTDAKPDTLHSPLLSNNLKGLPPALVNVAGADILRDEGIAFAEALQAAGGEVFLHVWPGMPHCFNGALATNPQTKEYYEKIVAFVKKYAEGRKAKL